jgi:hypothetical protein
MLHVVNTHKHTTCERGVLLGSIPVHNLQLHTIDSPYLGWPGAPGDGSQFSAGHLPRSDQSFVFGKTLPNFNLKNMILTYTKDFSWKK